CPTCRGGWFDSRELARVLSVAVEKLEPPADATKTSCVCPKCFVPLCRLPYPETKIEVDICEDCHGIWLDKGEFRDLNTQRAAHQDPDKFKEPPKSFNEAAFRFVDKILTKLRAYD
ncbi:zf-TFIIB domain-containing protein, partial [bacterium]|nr:zf-TFIIB domain-containing protein [bacterium]